MKQRADFFEINTQLMFLAILLPGAVVLRYSFGLSDLSSALMLLPAVFLFFYNIVAILQTQRFRVFSLYFVSVVVVLFTLFLLNLIASEDRLITFLKLFSFFNYVVYAYLQLIVFDRSISLKTLSLALNTSLIIFLIFAFDGIGSTYIGQTVGMYAGAAVIVSVFAQNTLKGKAVYSCFPVFMLILSGSRGSMLIVGALLLFVSLFMVKKKRFWRGLILLSLISVFIRPDIIIQNSFSSKILYADRSSQESLLISVLQRSERAVYGMEIFAEKPILGIGVGADIGGKMYRYLGKSQTPHNGYVSALVEGGYLLALPSFLFIFIGTINSFFRLVRSPSNITIAVILYIVYYLARALGENYLLYNFGNLVSILFIFFIVRGVFSKGDKQLTS